METLQSFHEELIATVKEGIVKERDIKESAVLAGDIEVAMRTKKWEEASSKALRLSSEMRVLGWEILVKCQCQSKK